MAFYLLKDISEVNNIAVVVIVMDVILSSLAFACYPDAVQCTSITELTTVNRLDGRNELVCQNMLVLVHN